MRQVLSTPSLQSSPFSLFSAAYAKAKLQRSNLCAHPLYQRPHESAIGQRLQQWFALLMASSICQSLLFSRLLCSHGRRVSVVVSSTYWAYIIRQPSHRFACRFRATPAARRRYVFRGLLSELLQLNHSEKRSLSGLCEAGTGIFSSSYERCLCRSWNLKIATASDQ